MAVRKLCVDSRFTGISIIEAIPTVAAAKDVPSGFGQYGIDLNSSCTRTTARKLKFKVDINYMRAESLSMVFHCSVRAKCFRVSGREELLSMNHVGAFADHEVIEQVDQSEMLTDPATLSSCASLTHREPIYHLIQSVRMAICSGCRRKLLQFSLS